MTACDQLQMVVPAKVGQRVFDLADDAIFIPNKLHPNILAFFYLFLPVVLRQLLAYHSGLLRGRGLDKKPHNLNESVAADW